MAAKTFGELVNDVVDESKVTLDHLTPANFLSPPRTVMYNRIKSWINMAYKELYIERNEWQFRVERATVELHPRVHLNDLTYVPSVGDVLAGQTSGTRFTVIAVHDFEDVEEDPSVERTLSVEFLDNKNLTDLIVGEVFDRHLPTIATGVGKLKGEGQYSLRDLVATLATPIYSSFVIYDHPGDMDTPAPGTLKNIHPLQFIESDCWLFPGCVNGSIVNGRPEYVTMTDQGHLALHPSPNEPYLLHFSYSRKIPQMVEFTDTPASLPEEFHDYLMWRAVQELADWDSNSKLFMRASKHVEKYTMWLHRDTIQKPVFAPSKF